MTRRGFLEKVIGFIATVLGVGFIGTILAYLQPRSQKGGRNILLSGDGSPIPAAQLKEKPYIVGLGINGEPTIIIKYGEEIRAFSAVCTHLGCLVKWLPVKGEFFCPCHAGRFDANGVNIAGPPPSPLTKYKAFVTKDGYIGLEGIPT